MSHKKKKLKMCTFAVLWRPEKEKMAHKNKEKCENFKFRSAGCSPWKA
jgi:hypothetical protein